MNNYQVCVVGDEIWDTYHEVELENGSWVKKNPDLTAMGGAANVATNILAMNDRVTLDIRYGDILTEKTRYFSDKNALRPVFEVAESIPLSGTLHKAIEYAAPVIFVLADYRKGALQGPPQIAYTPAMIIADSKHRSIHDGWFADNEAPRILHCTGDEWCPNFARKFDLVVHTDGPNDIWIRAGSSGERLVRLTPLPTKLSNPCGAGDTMTAAIAAYMAACWSPYRDLIPQLTDAVRYGLVCCAEVVAKPYTDTPTTKLEKYLGTV